MELLWCLDKSSQAPNLKPLTSTKTLNGLTKSKCTTIYSSKTKVSNTGLSIHQSGATTSSSSETQSDEGIGWVGSIMIHTRRETSTLKSNSSSTPLRRKRRNHRQPSHHLIRTESVGKERKIRRKQRRKKKLQRKLLSSKDQCFQMSSLRRSEELRLSRIYCHIRYTIILMESIRLLRSVSWREIFSNMREKWVLRTLLNSCLKLI